jgi:hypothetical protein
VCNPRFPLRTLLPFAACSAPRGFLLVISSSAAGGVAKPAAGPSPLAGALQ